MKKDWCYQFESDIKINCGPNAFCVSLERKYECYCYTGYQLVGGTFRTDLAGDGTVSEMGNLVGDGCEDIDECAGQTSLEQTTYGLGEIGTFEN